MGVLCILMEMEPEIPSPVEVVDAWQEALRAAELAERLATEAREAFQRSLPVEPPSPLLQDLAAHVAEAAAGATVQAFKLADETPSRGADWPGAGATAIPEVGA
jgi:hypothetical protein